MNNTKQKHGGRTAGTPNRITSELRTVLKNFVYSQLNGLEIALDDLQPKDKLELLVKLLPYILPKVKEINHDSNEPMTFDLY